MHQSSDSESVVRKIRRKTRRRYSAEERIRILLEGLKGEQSIAQLCRCAGISPNVYLVSCAVSSLTASRYCDLLASWPRQKTIRLVERIARNSSPGFEVVAWIAVWPSGRTSSS